MNARFAHNYSIHKKAWVRFPANGVFEYTGAFWAGKQTIFLRQEILRVWCSRCHFAPGFGAFLGSTWGFFFRWFSNGFHPWINYVLIEKGSARLQLLGIRAFYLVSSPSSPSGQSTVVKNTCFFTTLYFQFELFLVFFSQRSRGELL